MTQRDGMGWEVGEGFRMGNTCTPVADSCQCIGKPIQCCKVISLQKYKLKKKKKLPLPGFFLFSVSGRFTPGSSSKSCLALQDIYTEQLINNR